MTKETSSSTSVTKLTTSTCSSKAESASACRPRSRRTLLIQNSCSLSVTTRTSKSHISLLANASSDLYDTTMFVLCLDTFKVVPESIEKSDSKDAINLSKGSANSPTSKLSSHNKSTVAPFTFKKKQYRLDEKSLKEFKSMLDSPTHSSSRRPVFSKPPKAPKAEDKKVHELRVFAQNAILGEGTSFGEAALGINTGVTNENKHYKVGPSKVRIFRNARVVALTHLQCAVISKASFQEIRVKEPDFGEDALLECQHILTNNGLPHRLLYLTAKPKLIDLRINNYLLHQNDEVKGIFLIKQGELERRSLHKASSNSELNHTFGGSSVSPDKNSHRRTHTEGFLSFQSSAKANQSLYRDENRLIMGKHVVIGLDELECNKQTFEYSIKTVSAYAKVFFVSKTSIRIHLRVKKAPDQLNSEAEQDVKKSKAPMKIAKKIVKKMKKVLRPSKPHNRTMSKDNSDHMISQMYKLTDHCTKVDNTRLSRSIRKKLMARFHSMSTLSSNLKTATEPLAESKNKSHSMLKKQVHSITRIKGALSKDSKFHFKPMALHVVKRALKKQAYFGFNLLKNK
ncbi:unnamed protein product [Moneuplotes crassus]|uniref:Cyclic nucleotide-binding domain-containing protein n=1 Tax=Euplotes crassus TaxID=5936 RepID=A0AAD1YA36_EUPCR|nr:unnamed protein product [Moneuplotes crassus]